jgi:IS30 family transposase|tara:strand:- start:463 stop:600 length:138 start_codon:yes stop_codon:yes gene_type:complete
MTVDNGREFVGHKKIVSRLNVDIFFCHYHPHSKYFSFEIKMYALH